mgnify:CR=1 FL=1
MFLRHIQFLNFEFQTVFALSLEMRSQTQKSAIKNRQSKISPLFGGER